MTVKVVGKYTAALISMQTDADAKRAGVCALESSMFS